MNVDVYTCETGTLIDVLNLTCYNYLPTCQPFTCHASCHSVFWVSEGKTFKFSSLRYFRLLEYCLCACPRAVVNSKYRQTVFFIIPVTQASQNVAVDNIHNNKWTICIKQLTEVYHRSRMQTEKSQPEGKRIMPETRG